MCPIFECAPDTRHATRSHLNANISMQTERTLGGGCSSENNRKTLRKRHLNDFTRNVARSSSSIAKATLIVCNKSRNSIYTTNLLSHCVKFSTETMNTIEGTKTLIRNEIRKQILNSGHSKMLLFD